MAISSKRCVCGGGGGPTTYSGKFVLEINKIFSKKGGGGGGGGGGTGPPGSAPAKYHSCSAEVENS